VFKSKILLLRLTISRLLLVAPTTSGRADYFWSRRLLLFLECAVPFACEETVLLT